VVTDSTLLLADASAGIVMSLGRRGTVDTLYHGQDARGVVTPAMVEGAYEFLKNAEPRLVGLPGFEPNDFMESVGKVGDPLRSVWSDALWDARLLWLRHATPCFLDDGDAEPSRWDVVDPESRARVAVVELPAALRLLAVTSDRVLAVTPDEFDVERVGVYRIIR
jgi:hypothetical protein